MSTTSRFEDGMAELHAVGRVTEDTMGVFAALLDRALASPGPFVLLFDRRLMTAPTREGREALDHWAETYLPRLGGRCAAWVDLFDERRAAVMARAAAGRGEPAPDEDVDAPDWNGYPQRTMTDPRQATEWLQSHLDRARARTTEKGM